MQLSNAYAEKLRQAFGIDIIQDTDLELYLKKHYPRMPNVAYAQKRSIKEASYSIFLNELIQPNAYEVKKFRKTCLLSDDRLQRIRSTGNKVAQYLTWTDDANLATSGDYYLFPAEALTIKDCDCEDHAAVVSSLLPNDVASAWGFYKEGGHCFNVAVIEGKLYVIDTVGNTVVIKQYEGQSDYSINYIVTQRYTFVLDGTVSFGSIAGYDA
jgi:hypothetical protein